MVRVLRQDRPPEDVAGGGVSEDELREAHGHGTYLPQHQDYVCALDKEDLLDPLEQLNNADGMPSIDPNNNSPLNALQEWLREVCAGFPLLNPHALAMAAVIFMADAEWVTGVVRAAEAVGELSRPLLAVTPPPAQDQTVSSSVHEALVQGWAGTYHDPLRVLDYVAGVLDGYLRDWSKPLYHAAWTVVLQSSGWGKSRMLKELATKGFHVVYVSFMSAGQRGYPVRSPVAGVLSDFEAKDPRRVAAWVMAIVSQIGEKTPQEWTMEQQKDDFKERVADCYTHLKADVLKEVILCNPAPEKPWVSASLMIWLKSKIPDREMKIIVCLDEATSLFKRVSGSFLAFRRMFSSVPKSTKMKLFGIVSDTGAGKLINGLGCPDHGKMPDPSARALAPNIKVFRPIWVVGSLRWEVDEHTKQVLASHLMSGEDPTLPSLDFTNELFKLGRPLWRALIENLPDKLLEEGAAVEFAIQKLLGGVSLSSIDRNPHRVTEAMAIAVLGVAAGLEVAALSDLAKELVAGHMRTVSCVSGDGSDGVFTADLVEPILGEAAGWILSTDFASSSLLNVAQGVFKQCHVVEGPRGDIVGRLVLVLAMHACCKAKGGRAFNKYTRPVELRHFLEKLSGKRVEAAGLLCFNRFIFLNREDITKEHLFTCFLWGVAIIPQGKRYLGFDVLLPRLMPGLDGKYELGADRMVAVPIQMRNRDVSHSQKLASWWMPVVDAAGSNPMDVDQPAILKNRRRLLEDGQGVGVEFGIYLHLRGWGQSKGVKITDDNKVMVLTGLELPFLKRETVIALSAFSNAAGRIDSKLRRASEQVNSPKSERVKLEPDFFKFFYY